MAIVLDGKVISAPTNQQPITGGQAIITGSTTNPFSPGVVHAASPTHSSSALCR